MTIEERAREYAKGCEYSETELAVAKLAFQDGAKWAAEEAAKVAEAQRYSIELPGTKLSLKAVVDDVAAAIRKRFEEADNA